MPNNGVILTHSHETKTTAYNFEQYKIGSQTLVIVAIFNLLLIREN